MANFTGEILTLLSAEDEMGGETISPLQEDILGGDRLRLCEAN